MIGPRIASLCSGYRGLDAAVEAVFGGETAWVSDIDPGASKILAHRWPDTPNIGDLTTADWQQIADQYGPIDILCGGYPCQPFSLAGDLKGTSDERHLWPFIASALRVLRPRIAIFENVANHLRLGFDTVLADLAEIGFDAEWCLVRASEVGAPHQRNRLIVVATAADAADVGHERRGAARGRRAGSTDGSVAAADAERVGLQGQRGDAGAQPGRPAEAALGRRPVRSRGAAAHTASVGWGEGRPESARLERRPGAPLGSSTAPSNPDGLGQRQDEHDVCTGQPDAAWGRFLPAVRRWESATGRTAPRATDDRNRLSPVFV